MRINALNTLYQFPLSDELTSKNSEGIRKGLLAALADGDEHLAVRLKTLFFQILQTSANKPLTPVILVGPSTCKEKKNASSYKLPSSLQLVLKWIWFFMTFWRFKSELIQKRFWSALLWILFWNGFFMCSYNLPPPPMNTMYKLPVYKPLILKPVMKLYNPSSYL